MSGEPLAASLQRQGHETAEGAPGDAFILIVLRPPWFKRVGLRLRSALSDWRPYGVFGLVVAGLAAAAYHEHSKLLPLGARCSFSGECRSRQCLSFYEPGFEFTRLDWVHQSTQTGSVRGPMRRSGGVCTQTCARDEDCPASMTCAPAEQRSEMKGVQLAPVTITANSYACFPRE